MPLVVETDRLVVRTWQHGDRQPFAELNADPEVMRYFPSPLTSEESDAMVDRLMARHEREGLCFWAVALKGGPFVGMVGIQAVDDLEPALPASIEIGWRLTRAHWGNGYAVEAASACLRHGFEVHQIEEIVAFTTVDNARSRAVMTRIGMVHDPRADFDHPKLPSDDPLRPHVLYRARPEAFVRPGRSPLSDGERKGR